MNIIIKLYVLLFRRHNQYQKFLPKSNQDILKVIKNVLIGYVTVKSFRYIKVNRLNPLYVIIDKINRSIEESNGDKYLTVDPTDESKGIFNKYKEMQSKIRDLIRSITNNLDDYDKKYMKTKFNSNDDLPLNKTLEIRNMMVVRPVFHESNKLRF